MENLGRDMCIAFAIMAAMAAGLALMIGFVAGKLL